MKKSNYIKHVKTTSEYEYIKNKPKNSTLIYFKCMEECDGIYEISNQGHIKSNNGNKKILKYQFYSKNVASINLRNKNQKQEQFRIIDLMEKYFPEEVENWKNVYIHKHKQNI